MREPHLQHLPFDKMKLQWLRKMLLPFSKIVLLAPFKEVVLATLKVETEACDKPLLCLEADAGSGVAGIQWKKHLGEAVQVIAAEKKSTKTEFESACKQNGLRCSPWALHPDRTPGEWTKLEHGENVLYASQFSTNITLLHEAFNFVYLQPNNNLTSCVDAVFTNIRHNGLACFVSPNIASQCFRSPLLIRRLYQAHVLKTEYVKELAARIVIADIVRSASRHCRGVDILYTVCLEDHFLITARVLKKTQATMACAEQIRPVLHCLMCEERVVYPDVHSPVELPYTLLPCDCKNKHPGKTAVIIGPLWTGPIFNIPYLQQILAETKRTFSKSKTSSLLDAILTEAICSDSCCEKNVHNTTTEGAEETDLTNTKLDNEKTVTIAKEDNKCDAIHDDFDESKRSVDIAKLSTAEVTSAVENFAKSTDTEEPAEKRRKVQVNEDVTKPENGDTGALQTATAKKLDNEKTVTNAKEDNKCDAIHDDFDESKRSVDIAKTGALQTSTEDARPDTDTRKCSGSESGKGKQEGDDETQELRPASPTPLFYRNLHKQKYRGLPRSDKLVKFLREEGFRASRSHFEDHAIRTNANGAQLETAIAKFMAQRRSQNKTD